MAGTMVLRSTFADVVVTSNARNETALAVAAPAALTVEIHDVSPANAAEIATLVTAVREVGVGRLVLLVVPSWVDARGHFDLRADEELVAWLRDEAALGSEIVLHGLTHMAPRRPRGLRNQLSHRFFSRGCAEFAHLDADEARNRLHAGLRILEDCGFRPEGFVAPAWQQSDAAQAAVREFGFRWTAFLDRVVVLKDAPAEHPTHALTFDAANPAIDYGKRAYMRGVEAIERTAPLLRVALHPRDVHGRVPARHAVKRIQGLLRERQLVTVSDWIARGAASHAT